jgi:hypothetical protein
VKDEFARRPKQLLPHGSAKQKIKKIAGKRPGQIPPCDATAQPAEGPTYEHGAVFVANISRLSRQVIDVELFRLRAALHNVLLYMDGQLINPADSNDVILAQMTAMFAQFENRQRAEIIEAREIGQG